MRTAPVSALLDPIEVSAVLLECSGRRVLIFSFDLLQVGSELQKMILKRIQPMGFAADQIVLLASHTHNAPATDSACKPLGVPDPQFLSDLTDAAEELVLKIKSQPLATVRLEIFQGHLNHSINRRRYWPFPTFSRMHGFRLTSVAFSPNPFGPKNELATAVILKRDTDGQSVCVVWHYTCHPTAVAPDHVISSDYPGAVRFALRQQLGEVPCVFLQGFCGNIRPDIKPVPRRLSIGERCARFVRIIAFGNLFPTHLHRDWTLWSHSLAARISQIVQDSPVKTCFPADIRTGLARLPFDVFFRGSTPDKPLVAHVVRIGHDLEFVALSGEATVEWESILNQAIPVGAETIRLYAGYLGALCAYLPTAAQVPEGGYEVEGFQRFFGLAGQFDADQIDSAVMGCVKAAFVAANEHCEMPRDDCNETLPAENSGNW